MELQSYESLPAWLRYCCFQINSPTNLTICWNVMQSKSTDHRSLKLLHELPDDLDWSLLPQTLACFHTGMAYLLHTAAHCIQKCSGEFVEQNMWKLGSNLYSFIITNIEYHFGWSWNLYQFYWSTHLKPGCFSEDTSWQFISFVNLYFANLLSRNQN